MKKILNDLIHQPDDCEIGVISCLQTMYYKEEKTVLPKEIIRIPRWCPRLNRRCNQCGFCSNGNSEAGFWLGWPSLHCLLATISGIALVAPDLSISDKLSNGLEESFLSVVDDYDDYLGFLCQFLGYTHMEYGPDCNKEELFLKIKECIDQDKALMLQSSVDNRWAVIQGYDDEDHSIFIFKWNTVVLANDPVNVEKVRVTDWYENFSRIIHFAKKDKVKLITHRVAFSRLFRLLKNGHDHHYYSNSIQYILDDSHYATVSREVLEKEYTKLSNFFFGIVINRCNSDWCFDNFYEMHGTNWAEKFAEDFKFISMSCGLQHDLGQITNGCILEELHQNISRDETIEMLRNRKNRAVLAQTLELISAVDSRIMDTIWKIATTP